MGDVMKKTDDAEREFANKIMRDSLANEAIAEKAERKAKDLARKRELNLIRELGDQVNRKRQQREKEQEQNNEYI